MGMSCSGTATRYAVSLHDTVPHVLSLAKIMRGEKWGEVEAVDLVQVFHHLIGWVLFANPRVLEIQVTSLNPPAVVGVCVNASERRDKWLTLWSIFISNSAQQKREGGFCVANLIDLILILQSQVWFGWRSCVGILALRCWEWHRPVISLQPTSPSKASRSIKGKKSKLSYTSMFFPDSSLSFLNRRCHLVLL